MKLRRLAFAVGLAVAAVSCGSESDGPGDDGSGSDAATDTKRFDAPSTDSSMADARVADAAEDTRPMDAAIGGDVGADSRSQDVSAGDVTGTDGLPGDASTADRVPTDDASSPDTSTPDASTMDSGAVDSVVTPDAWITDASIADVNNADSDATDAWPADSSPPDGPDAADAQLDGPDSPDAPVSDGAPADTIDPDVQRYAVAVTLAGNGSGTVTSSPAGINCGGTCSALFNDGQDVTLTASPATGSTFTGWSGSSCAGTNPCIIAVTAASSVTATFTLLQYPLSVLQNGHGDGNGDIESRRNRLRRDLLGGLRPRDRRLSLRAFQ